MLEVSDISVAYRGIHALVAASLVVGAGELVSLVGANGAGKTTLLRAISGTVPASGEVRLAGVSLQGMPAHLRTRHGVIHVPQGRHVFSSMTIEENLLVATSYRGNAGLLDVVYELFPALKLKRRQAAGTLSGGQQQMLAIGRGIAADPRLLMLDEPSTGVSPALVDDIFAAIARMRAARPVALLLVEQRATAALALSDRCYVIEQGRIVLSGRSRDLRNDDRLRQAYFGI